MQLAFPIVGLAAGSGTGKTTLLLKAIPLLKSRGVRVGLIKRAHHTFDTDKPGKDSYELRKAGAARQPPALRRPVGELVADPAHLDLREPFDVARTGLRVPQ
jgi:hypothetical protein